RLEASGADAELVRLARDCLARDLADRPRDAGEVAARLTAYRAGVQQRLRQAELERTRAEVQAGEERKRRRLAVGLAAGLLLRVLAGGGGAWRLQQQRAAARSRQAQADGEALQALGRGRGLLGKGWQAHDLGKLAEARAEAERAADIARSGAASATVRQQT